MLHGIASFLRALAALPGLDFLTDIANRIDEGRMAYEDQEDAVEYRKKDLRGVKGSARKLRR